MNVTKETCKNVRVDIDKALEKIAKKYKLSSPGIGTVRFDPNSLRFTVKLAATKIDAKSGKVVSAEANSYKENCTRFGLKKTWFGRDFIIKGRRFKLTGLKTSRPKFPVEAVEVGGRCGGFKFTPDTIRFAFGEYTKR